MANAAPEALVADEGILDHLAARFPDSPAHVRLKAALLFAGVRYDAHFADAGLWAFPSYMPFQLPTGEPSWRGKRSFHVPYLARMADNGQVRLRIKPESPFSIRPEPNRYGFTLYCGDRPVSEMTYEPRLPWADQLTGDGTPMRATGLSQHGDMLVMNVAPGCEFFTVPRTDGTSENLHCKFCLYGLPDKQRLEPLGQQLFQAHVPKTTLDRVVQACHHPQTNASQLYLVSGSMLDMAAEGERFVQIAQRLHAEGLTDRYYVACGSGAVPKDKLKEMRDFGVRGASFNLEVWDPAQFSRVCPGKDRLIGRDRWLRALEDAVDVFGPDNVLSAFVAGAEMDGEGGFTDVEQALESNIAAGEYLIPRGIQPVFSLHWKVTGKNRGDEPFYTLPMFLQLNEALAKIRRREGRLINSAFFSRRSAYMQLEPDYDEPARAADPVAFPAPTPWTGESAEGAPA